MENNKAFIIRNKNVIGMDVQRVYASTPIGIIQPFASDTNIPRGYLICNGASYKVADYPDLYAVIGNTYGGDTENFNVPDYRETVLVGVGENTTDTIASHDVYELGEFKDDQLQGHEHNTYKNYESNATGGSGGDTIYGGVVQTPGIVSDGTNGEPRKGTTTHGKQKGVTYIIKAFHTNEGVDSKNEVSDPIINYVESKVDGLISDTTSSTTSTWSSKKTSDEIAKVDTELNANLGEKADLIYKTTVTNADDLPDGFISAFDLTNAPQTGHVFYRTFSYDGNTGYRVQEATLIGTTKKFIRYKNQGIWEAWQELATMDKVNDGYAKVIKNNDTDANEGMLISYKNRDEFGIRIYKNDDSEHELKFSASGISYVKDGVTVWTK